jgi:hypothetical protein
LKNGFSSLLVSQIAEEAVFQALSTNQHHLIYFLKRHQIADLQWNQFIEASPQAILYAYSWYLDAVSPQWGALVVIERNEWQAVLPLPLRKKWGMQVIQQPFFCQFLGVFSNNKTDFQDFTPLLLQSLPTYFRYVSVYSGRFFGGDFPDAYEVQQCKTHLLPLNFPYATLQKNYTADRRMNLRRAQKFQWQLQESNDLGPLIDLFRQNHAAQIEGGVSENAYDLLRKVHEVLQEKQAVRLRYAIYNGQIEAGAMFVVYQKRIIYLFNAASATGRQGNARTWLIDQIIQEYAETDFVFDFESPEVASIAGFYQSFGAKKEIYSTLHYNGLPFPLKQLQARRRKKKD